jgi:CDP-paratose 2-epimerase
VRILITGACGFVGSTLARAWVQSGSPHFLLGLDSLVRPGAEVNRQALREMGVRLFHGDIRHASDLEDLPEVDLVIDTAATPSVLAGVVAGMSPRQLVEHNLLGTISILEYCRRHRAQLILLSTSRAYSLQPLAALRMTVVDEAFEPARDQMWPPGLGPAGVREDFSTASPVSLYGATKLASEQLALEYGATFGFSVWVSRCGLLAGAGQFGRPDQGIFSYWINSWLRRKPLRYIGFGGRGHQVRDCLHPADLGPLLELQMSASGTETRRIINVSGGRESALSLRQLSNWCSTRLGGHHVASDDSRRLFDVPWLVLDSAEAQRVWAWKPSRPIETILGEILDHARCHPHWLELSGLP